MAYNPTVYLNDNPPAINADNLNKNENELARLSEVNESEFVPLQRDVVLKVGSTLYKLFSMTANHPHSATADNLYFDLPAQTTFIGNVVLSTGEVLSGTLVGYKVSGQKNLATFNSGTPFHVLTTEDYVSFGVYLPKPLADATVTYSMEITGTIENQLKEFDELEEITGTFYHKNFIASGNHSSQNDRIDVDIPANNKFSIETLFGNGAKPNCSYAAVKSDGTAVTLGSSADGSKKVFVKDYDIKKIGVYFESVGTNVNVTMNVIKFGEFQEIKEIVEPSQYTTFSINGDGLTKRYYNNTANKKLYISEQGVTTPTKNQQGAAYENGMMIIATHDLNTQGDNATLDVWNYDTQTRLYSFSVPNDVIYHGNTVSATGIKIDENDLCSLLLVSDSKAQGGFHVCRLTTSECSVLHSILCDPDKTGYYANYAYNDKNGTIVSIGYKQQTVTDGTDNNLIICVWEISGWNNADPEADITTTLRYRFELPFMDILNGMIIKNGILYAVFTPFQHDDYTYIAVIPLDIKAATNRWTLNNKVEYENINFIDDENMIVGSYWFATYSIS